MECGECEPIGHRSELVSTLNALFAESSLKDPADRGHKRAPAGQEDAIDIFGSDATSLEKRFDRSLDPSQFHRNPSLEICTRKRNTKVKAAFTKSKLRDFLPRQLDLHLLDSLVQLISQVFLHQVRQSLDLLRLQRPRSCTPQD